MSKNFSGFEKAPARAVLRSLGLSSNDLSKPLIAVIKEENGMSLATKRIDAVVDSVKSGIMANGGTPFVLSVSGICDEIATGTSGMSYSLPSRELVADLTEALILGHAFDGIVLVSGSSECAVGMLMGALRVNLPTVVLSCGGSLSGSYDGQRTCLANIFEASGATGAGRMSLAKLTELEDEVIASDGSYSGMFSANSVACLFEALGIAPDGNGTALAGSADRLRLARKTGKYIMDAVSEDITPKMILTREAFNNAGACICAFGASTDTVLHLIALANECGFELTYDNLQKISNATPTLCNLSPTSEQDMKDFDDAGGVRAVMCELATKGLLNGSARTISGKMLETVFADKGTTNTSVIHTIDDPISDVGALAFLKGNIAENGSVIRRSNVPEEYQNKPFIGKAKCFNSEEEATLAVVGGRITDEDVVVIRNEGPKHGMRQILSPVATLAGLGLDKTVAVITDGRLSGMVKGIAVGHLSPEALDGGKIGIIADGDKIKIDVKAGKIDLDIPSKEIANRTKRFHPSDISLSGYLLRYSKLVTGAECGAVLKKKF